MGDFIFLFGSLLWFLVKGIFLLITWPFRFLWRKHKDRQWENQRAAERAMAQLTRERENRQHQDKVNQVFDTSVKQWFKNPNRLPQKVVLYYDKMTYSDIDGPSFICPYCKTLEMWSDYWNTEGYQSNDFNELYYLAQKINYLANERYFIYQKLEEKITYPFKDVTAYHYLQMHIEMTLK